MRKKAGKVARTVFLMLLRVLNDWRFGKVSEIENRLVFDKNVFKEYFRSHGWTLDIYEDFINKSLFRSNNLKDNHVYPSARRLRALYNSGYIPRQDAIQLCQFFNCQPEELGIYS